MLDRIAKIIFTYYSRNAFKPTARIQTLGLLGSFATNIILTLFFLSIFLICLWSEKVEIALFSISMETGMYTSLSSFLILNGMCYYYFHRKFPVLKRDVDLTRNGLRLNFSFVFVMIIWAISFIFLVFIPLYFINSMYLLN